MSFVKHIFYNTNELSIAEKLSMLRDCKAISYEWRADKLDCSVSIQRQSFDCSFDEILSYLQDSTHVVVINRGTWGSPLGDDREHFEIGFRTMEGRIDYFLFIQVDTVKMSPILEKYQLKPIEY
jgi:hypothetical protein